MLNTENLLLLLPGPKYNLEATLGPKLRLLSEQYSGIVITTGSHKKQEKIGRFLIVCGKYQLSKYREYTDFRSLVISTLSDDNLRPILGENPVIVSYDPLRAGLVGIRAKQLINAPLVIEINGVFQSKYNYIESPNKIAMRLKKIRNKLVISHVLKHADAIKLLFPGQLKGLYKPGKQQTQETYFDWVATESFYPQPNKTTRRKTILFVGYPHFLKGVDLLIWAFKELYPEHQDWQLKILAWYPDIAVIKEAINSHPAIEYHLPVKHDQMPKHMADASIFALPSRTEAMGRVLLEAGAAGLARVASNVDGIPVVINDGKDGLLFRSGDRIDLLKQLALLMNDSSLRKTLGNAAQARVRRDFNSDNYMAHTSRFYNNVLAQKLEHRV